MSYSQKYAKYKKKYLDLKRKKIQEGGEQGWWDWITGKQETVSIQQKLTDTTTKTQQILPKFEKHSFAYWLASSQWMPSKLSYNFVTIDPDKFAKGLKSADMSYDEFIKAKQSLEKNSPSFKLDPGLVYFYVVELEKAIKNMTDENKKNEYTKYLYNFTSKYVQNAIKDKPQDFMVPYFNDLINVLGRYGTQDWQQTQVRNFRKELTK